MKNERKVILYIASSLDGYIAKPGDDLSFLNVVEEEGEDYGYYAFLDSIDTIIIGRKTYDWVLNEVGVFPNDNKECYIITRTPKPGSGNIYFFTGDINNLVEELKNKSGKNIFVDGGAEIVLEMLRLQLIDEMIISVIPVLLGCGTRLFGNDFPEQTLELLTTKQFKKGLVQLHYRVLKPVKDLA